ncbi:MAG: phosphopyruvate hydratase [Clostridia bacterium]|nr:phosphopyruvate hydratase [Clostridia bacterium]
MTNISNVMGMEMLDSRGNPTVAVRVELSDGSKGVALAPSGASTGRYEACELRDEENERYGGKGVLKAVGFVNSFIREALCGAVPDQREIDRILIEHDGTENKSHMGANAILATSLAVARAAAKHLGIPLYRYLGGIYPHTMPIPCMNILNGGAHASNNLDIQEFMIVPTETKNFAEAVRYGSEIYHKLGELLKAKGRSVAVGDEGGFAPDLKDDREALQFIVEAIEKSGHADSGVKLALDIAASEWYRDGKYHLPKQGKTMESEELIDYIDALCHEFPILSVEDGMGEDDFGGWQALTDRLNNEILLVGDDLFVTNAERLKKGFALGMANTILIKPNQIGTLTETLDVISLAHRNRYHTMISHRSGETEDTFIADLAVATGSPYIKTGAPCRSERVAKYNRLMLIEKDK